MPFYDSSKHAWFDTDDIGHDGPPAGATAAEFFDSNVANLLNDYLRHVTNGAGSVAVSGVPKEDIERIADTLAVTGLTVELVEYSDLDQLILDRPEYHLRVIKGTPEIK
jgi:hypothetical protein